MEPAMTTTYRLHNGQRTITRGPLALVAGQSHRSATDGTPLLISDSDSNTVAIHPHHGTIWATWQQPAQLALFADASTQRCPDWYDRLLLLIVELNNDTTNIDTNHELPPHMNITQKASL